MFWEINLRVADSLINLYYLRVVYTMNKVLHQLCCIFKIKRFVLPYNGVSISMTSFEDETVTI